MNTPLVPEEIERVARRRAGAKIGWYVHASVYLLVNLLWLAMSTYGFGTRTWHVLPSLGWGLGLALHGVSVWVVGRGSSFRERMVQRERERLLREHGKP
ncbi:MAG: 2TM domain-containing protein [Rhodoferax sp.]